MTPVQRVTLVPQFVDRTDSRLEHDDIKAAAQSSIHLHIWHEVFADGGGSLAQASGPGKARGQVVVSIGLASPSTTLTALRESK